MASFLQALPFRALGSPLKGWEGSSWDAGRASICLQVSWLGQGRGLRSIISARAPAGSLVSQGLGGGKEKGNEKRQDPDPATLGWRSHTLLGRAHPPISQRRSVKLRGLTLGWQHPGPTAGVPGRDQEATKPLSSDTLGAHRWDAPGHPGLNPERLGNHSAEIGE